MSMKEFGREEDIIDYDFQGWPVYKMNIRSILKSLGFECEGGKWIIDDADPTLDIYPCVLEDDGMGYGVNEQCITSVDVFENDGQRYCNVFVDKPNEKVINDVNSHCYADDKEEMIEHEEN